MKPKCCQDDQDMGESREVVELLKAVAEGNRLRILCILKKGECCVCRIIEYLGLSQSLVSHHLKCLKEAGLVQDSRRGAWVYYSLTAKGKRIARLIAKLN